MVIWLRTARGTRRFVDRYDPRFYVHGTPHDLDSLAADLVSDPAVKELSWERYPLSLDDDTPQPVLGVAIRHYAKLRPLAERVEQRGEYARYQLFNVDLRLSYRYLLEHRIFPLAKIRVGDGYEALEKQYALDYTIPPLHAVTLELRARRSGPAIRYADPVEEIAITPCPAGGPDATPLPCDAGYEHRCARTVTMDATRDEATLMLEAAAALAALDPDIVYTENGDSVLLPYLYHRAEQCGIRDRFQLGREPTPARAPDCERGRAPHPSARTHARPLQSSLAIHGVDANTDANTDTVPDGDWNAADDARADPESVVKARGKSYFTYGHMIYKPPYYRLRGRIHIDRRHSFHYRESGLHGLIELARLSSIPLQTVSRLSSGTVISSLQVTRALRDGRLVRWKKNRPETFKSALELFVADRGGFIFQPRVGLHRRVLGVDFTSLYPHIMLKNNISPETLECPCCPDSAQRVPELGYRLCERRMGLIPRVLEPLLARRIVYKRRRDEPRFAARDRALKWVLVTCFGYTGYKNARFGRIECHEAITAYGRDILLEAMRIAEARGYRVLHGIVDSLWLTCDDHTAADHAALCAAIEDAIGIPIDIEGFYRWVAFLPNRGNGVGALNRYYGLFEDGELKVRGIELRRRDTPPLFCALQRDLLDTMAVPRDLAALKRAVPTLLDIVRRYARRVRDGDCDPRDLLYTTVVSRTLENYRQLNNQYAALAQLAKNGVEIEPGEKVRYLVCNQRARQPEGKVCAEPLLSGEERYDRAFYLRHLLKSAATLLVPFGYTEERLREALRRGTQTELESYLAANTGLGMRE